MSRAPSLPRAPGRGARADAELSFEELVEAVDDDLIDGPSESVTSGAGGAHAFFAELMGESFTKPAPKLRTDAGARARGHAQRRTSSGSSAAEAPPPPAPALSPTLTITRPATQTLWVLLLEPEQDSFLIQGISQRGALWTSTTGSGSLTVTHGGPANGAGDRAGPAGAAGVQVRVGERGLVVQGQVDAGATGVQVQVVTSAGTPIPLRTSPTAATTSVNLSATLSAPAAGATTRAFEAVVFFDDPSSRFGRVQVKAESVGLAAAARATADVLLVGAQIALVDDRAGDVGGAVRGPVRTEADERIVVDFVDSPQGTRAAISDQTRARRMIVHEIAQRSRPLSATLATPVGQPEMPMWMAELQIVGVNAASLAAFMGARAAAPGGRRTLEIAAQWRLRASWHGPNAGAGGTRPYSYTQDWTGSATARLALDATGRAIDGMRATGEVPGALTPAPSAPAFPGAGRRTPQVVVDGVTRRWGRRSTTALVPTMIVEQQPLLVDAGGREIMRGGDSKLELTSLSVDGAAVDPGRVATATGTAAPATGAAPAMLPTFRIQGRNLPAADRRPLIDALVDEYVRAHAADAWIAVLPLAAWQTTAWLVLDHESIGGQHFDERGTGRRSYGGRFFGNEPDMPIFGPPAGYGWGQLDDPPVTDDAAWSFADNARAAIALLLGAKAQAAYNAMHAHFPTPVDRNARAAFRRETVRRYNGGTELHWNGTAWEILPTLAQRDSHGDPNPRLPYANAVLGTSIVYWTGAGATATFAWPIAFPAAQYGPGI